MLEFQQWAVNRGYLDTIVTEDKLWDGRFVKYAAKTLNLGE